MMRSTGIPQILAVLVFLSAALPTILPAAPSTAAEPPDAEANAAKGVRALFENYCFECHKGEDAEGILDLSRLLDQGTTPGNRKRWVRVMDNVEGGTMPPDDYPQPREDEVEALRLWVDAELEKVDCGQTVDPGRVTIRRLNRAEYNNTIRDLVGVDFHPADDFPSDDVGYGFDNIGDVLTLPPILMEKYLAAAESIAKRAIVVEGESAGEPAKEYPGRALASTGEARARHEFPRDATYVLRIRAYGQQAGPDPARMTVKLDGEPLETFDVRAVEEEPGVYEARAKVKAGVRRIAAAFINDYYDPDNPDPSLRGDRNLFVDSLEVEGPIHEADDPLPESHKRIIFRSPQSPDEFHECASAVIERFMRRAYRRPVTGGEVAKLVRLAELARENGDGFERGMQLAVQAVLASPQFLFRVELYRPKRDRKGKVIDPTGGAPLNDFEVASRLSYFLWSSMPDDELSSLAEQGALLKPEILEEQVRRMLADPKAESFVENFAGQWLQLRRLKDSNPDRKQFPDFDEPLREAMARESELYFASIMREDRSLLDFIDGDYTFLNERLAKHYGIPGVEGPEFRRVKLETNQRGGVITQASILTVTSNPSRTSPVNRGKWILEQILGDPPPPAPPEVPILADDAEGAVLTGTLRQRMEQHRSNPSCAACHARLDPPGFGLENYDAVGAWRDKEGDNPIDASAELPSGESFNGPAELKAILKSRKGAFIHTLSEKMLTYALGRGLEESDACVVEAISKAVAADEYRFSRMVLEIVKSDPFLKRRG